MPDNPKLTDPTRPPKDDELLYGDVVFDPHILDKVSPGMREWLADFIEKGKAIKPEKEPPPATKNVEE